MSLPPIATRATYTDAITHGFHREILLGWQVLPAAANLATAPRGVALDIWPPVLE